MNPEPSRLADYLRATSSSATTTLEPVLLVHGTFANRRSERVDWWQPGSTFCADIDVALAGAGSRARCWSHLDGAQRAPFAWTGANSERDRCAAGLALADAIGRLECDPAVSRYHLIGHSHGGNVIVNALLSAKAAPAKLGAVVFIGTPALSFRHRGALDSRWVAIPVDIALLALCYWAFGRFEAQQLYIGIAGVTIALALVMELARPGAAARRADPALYGRGKPSAFLFPGDEAIDALVTARDVKHEPRAVIEQFLAVETPPPPAVPPTPAPEITFDDRLRGTGAYELLQRLQPASASFAIGGTVPMIDARSPTESRWPFWARLLQNLSAGFPLQPFVLLVLWAVAILPLAIMIGAATVYAAITRVAAAAAGALVLYGGKLLGRVALPILVGRAAFGANLGTFVDVSPLPPGVEAAEPLDAALHAEVSALSARLGQSAGQAVLRAIAKRDALAIKSHVMLALTDSGSRVARRRALRHPQIWRAQ